MPVTQTFFLCLLKTFSGSVKSISCVRFPSSIDVYACHSMVGCETKVAVVVEPLIGLRIYPFFFFNWPRILIFSAELIDICMNRLIDVLYCRGACFTLTTVPALNITFVRCVPNQKLETFMNNK